MDKLLKSVFGNIFLSHSTIPLFLQSLTIKRFENHIIKLEFEKICFNFFEQIVLNIPYGISKTLFRE